MDAISIVALTADTFVFVFVFRFVFVFVLRERREDVEEEGVFLRESESSIIDGAFENVNLG